MTQVQDDPPARGADILPFPGRRPAPTPAPMDDFGDDFSGDDSDDDGPSAA